MLRNATRSSERIFLIVYSRVMNDCVLCANQEGGMGKKRADDNICGLFKPYLTTYVLESVSKC